MQSHQLILTLGILWLATLVIMPFLFAKSRHLAYMRGRTEGKECVDSSLKLRIRTLEEQLADTNIENEADTRKRLKAIASLQSTIAELEARIMSYTGMAVTRADYDLLAETARTLGLTERTLNALKANQQAQRANEQIQQLTQLAMRLHAHLRATPATAGAAA
ncbi:hypothetical protein IAE35_05200 [Pseudomonas sp. S75]|uniref:hypothetical protein n=1 Tax=unclassified Pseudomonas TaxID=196821 RepID=UPI0019042085|nr:MULTISPECIES: hypothetical protein [unclassified Pseudomonas]MBJ9975297.1 hypothetical protein [Pseudomonas sp. S30]MBK0152729.1 hypothetical protein [Pseudomonas sp. S75]